MQLDTNAKGFTSKKFLNPMTRYPSIEKLVVDLVTKHKGSLDYETVTSNFKTAFPTSKWDKKHWAWYRTQIVNGRFKNPLFLDVLCYHPPRKIHPASV